jgi:outer membrane protein assembly factor BamB
MIPVNINSERSEETTEREGSRLGEPGYPRLLDAIHGWPDTAGFMPKNACTPAQTGSTPPMNCSGPRRGSLPTRRSIDRRPPSRGVSGVFSLSVVALLMASLLAGCASNPKPAPGSSTNTSGTTSTPTSTDATTDANLEASYLIGPSAARDIGARIVWQKRLTPTSGSGFKHISVQGDSVFVIDGRNMLTRLNRESGDRVWTLPVAGPVDDVQGLIYLPEEEKVLVEVADALLVLDSTVGSLAARQKFTRIASTPPVLFGNSILYGSINGQLVWHSHVVGTQFRAYQVADSIKTKPVVDGNIVIVTGSNGMVMALNASAAAQLWSKRLLDEIVAAPVVGNGAVFVAGMDQSLWALELGNGRNIWRYRTESPLSSAPTLIEDRVYQFVPGKGLVCLEAVPLDAPAGEVIWESPDVTGRVIVDRRDTLLVWDETRRTLALVSGGSGTVINKISLPGVRHLEATNLEGGELFAAGDDGRVIHLVWRN